MDQKINRIYYLETFLLLGFFIALTLILSNSFVYSRQLSNEAEDLSNAVCIAENMAEMFKGAKDEKELLSLLQTESALSVVKEGGKEIITVYYNKDREPDILGSYRITLSYESEKSSQSGIREADITVYNVNTKMELYALSVGKLTREVVYE